MGKQKKEVDFNVVFLKAFSIILLLASVKITLCNLFSIILYYVK